MPKIKHSLLGSNRLKIRINKYIPGGVATNYVIMFKVLNGVSMPNESVQACQMEAESNALLYWLRQ